MKLIILILSCFIQPAVFSQPVITSFAPASGPIGTSVVIAGSGFSAGTANNIVYFGAVRGVVTAATATSLTVTVPPGASYHPISVTTSGLTVFSIKPFSVTFAGSGSITSGTFSPRVDLPANAGGTISIRIKDLDSDGKPDITAGNISVYKNNSTVATPAISAPLNLTPNSLYYYTAVEDIDGDGQLDILAPVLAGNNVKIFRNITSGASPAFGPAITLTTSGGFGIAAADFDNDGHIDFATTNDGNPGRFSVHRNTSSIGNISFAANVDFMTDPRPRAMATAFINDDDKPDLVITHISPSNTLRVFINTSTPGNISFTAQNPMASAAGINGTAVGDFDGDDKTDIAIVTANAGLTGIASLYRNTGSGSSVSFAPRVDLATGTNWNPGAVAVADIDGDGKPEITVSHRANNAVSVFRNTSTAGTFSFDPKIDFIAPEPIQYALEVTDFNVDGKPDICVGSYYPNTVISIFKSAGVVVPVPPDTLTYFNVAFTNNDAYLSWATGSENSLQRFEIEVSTDGQTYTLLTQVIATGGSAGHQYTYTHVNAKSIQAPMLYYRLKLVKIDGSFTYGNVASLAIVNTTPTTGTNPAVVSNSPFAIVHISPSPFRDNFTLNISADKAMNATLKIIDAAGNSLSRRDVALQNGNNTVTVSGANLPAGVYTLQLFGDGRVLTARVVKQ